MKSITKSLFSTAASVIFVALSVFFVLDFFHSHQSIKETEQRLVERQKQLADEKKKNEVLKDQQRKLDDPSYVKDYARGNFMLSENNEQIFILPKQQ